MADTISKEADSFLDNILLRYTAVWAAKQARYGGNPNRVASQLDTVRETLDRNSMISLKDVHNQVGNDLKDALSPIVDKITELEKKIGHLPKH